MRYDLENVNDDELIDELGRTMTKVSFFEPEELESVSLKEILQRIGTNAENYSRLVVMTEDDYDSDADVMNEISVRYHKKWR